MPALLDPPDYREVTGMDAQQFGARLRELRSAAGFSQKALADRAGVSQNAISQWEAGDREPLVSNVAALADALGVDVGELFKAAQVVAPEPRRGRPPKPDEPPRRG